MFSRKSKIIRNIMVSTAIIAAFTAPISAEDEVSETVCIRLYDDGTNKLLNCAGNATIGDALAENGVEIGAYDKINADLSARVEDEMSISISRAKTVNVTVDNEVYRSFRTECKTVGQLMEYLEKEDNAEYVIVGENTDKKTKIENDHDIKFATLTEEFTDTTEEIPFETITFEDDKLEKGLTKVTVEGKNGIRTNHCKTTFISGENRGTEIVSSEITLNPVNKVVAIGTYVKPVEKTVTTENGEYTYSDEIDMSATGYCAYAPGCGLYTATGAIAKKGIVAVDPKVIPLGTKLYIPGYGSAVAGDTGGAIKGNRIDLCFDSYDQAVQFGRKGMKVFILKDKAI